MEEGSQEGAEACVPSLRKSIRAGASATMKHGVDGCEQETLMYAFCRWENRGRSPNYTPLVSFCDVVLSSLLHENDALVDRGYEK